MSRVIAVISLFALLPFLAAAEGAVHAQPASAGHGELAAAVTGSAEGESASAASGSGAGLVTATIRFFDKRIYYPGAAISIKVSIANDSPRTWRFRLAENRVHSLNFEVRNPANRLLDAAMSFKRVRLDAGPVFYRDLSIEPGEEYSFVEDLASYAAIVDPGSFAVQASFWPELAPPAGPAGQEPLLSNILMLSVRPSPAASPTALAAIKAETGEILRPESIPPDEVVSRTIEARQRQRWSEFFLYLDLEALLKRSPELARAYNRESDEGRRRMLESFKTGLEGLKNETAIVTLPKEYSVVETRYTVDTGFVSVIEKFQEKGFVSVKEYEYELRRRADVWYIVNYTVLNKGTE